jgi:hypothetical protein
MQRPLSLILLALVLLALPRPTVIEEAGAQLNYGGGSAPHVATNAALTAATIAAYPHGVWRDDFAADNGAPPLFYRPSGSNCTLNSGAGDNGGQVAANGVGCWLAAFPAPGIDIREFGAVATGTNDSGPAISAAMSVAGGATVLVPAGTFKCNSQISLAMPAGGFTIQGKGSALSTLYFPTTSGLALTMADGNRAPHIRDLTLLTGAVGTSTGITITQNSASFDTTEIADITNVTLKGNDGLTFTKYWSTGIVLNNVSYLNSYGLSIIGAAGATGISATANSTTPSYISNFTSANFENIGVGITLGNWVQGITVSQSNFGGSIGISVPSSVSTGQVQLTLLGNQWNDTAAAVDSEGPFADIMFHDNLVLAPSGGTGIIIGNATRVSIQNNHFVALDVGTGKAIDIKSTGGLGLGGIVSGNLINGFATGVNLQDSAANFTVTHNVNQGNTAFVTNVGTNNAIDGDTVTSSIASGSAISLTTGTSANVTSISVPPGNWLIRGNIRFLTGGTTVVTSIGSSISTVTNTFSTNQLQLPVGGVAGFAFALDAPTVYFNFTTTTTVYLVAISGFTTSTQSAYGSITAVRQLQ